MNTKLILAAALLIVVVPASALADNGLFLAASVGSADLNENFDGFDVDSSSTAYRLTVGWQFNDYFALEGGYNNFGDFEQSFDIDGAPVDVSLTADGFTLGATGNLPLGERWILSARAGAFFWDGDASINNVSAATPEDANIYLGIGAGFKVTEHLSLTIDGSRYDLDGAESAVLSAGLKYKF